MRSVWLVLSTLFVCSLLCGAQGVPKGYDGPLPMPGRRPEVWKADPQPAQARKIDVIKLKTQADEMAKLAAGVPPDIEQLKRGLLSKDLEHNLKRIEKLSKQLRQELNQ
jgi:hypothetical protein